jgi:hypothetical protein
VLFTQVVKLHYEADDLLERGVMAELDGKPEPEHFKTALQRFEESLEAMNALDKSMEELVAIHRRGKSLKVFDVAVSKILRQMDPVERVSLRGLRYSNLPARKEDKKRNPRNLLEIMQAQRADLAVLREQLGVTIEAFRAVLPLAEQHEFSAMMLSGRAGFADKILQQVNLINVFSKFYTRTCLTTIDATMQVYPKGLEWLKDSRAQGPTRQENIVH